MLRSATASKAIPAESDPNDADPTNEPSSASAQGGSEEAPSTDRSNFYLQNRETFACLRISAIAQRQGSGPVVVEPYPNPVAGNWQVFQGQPNQVGGNRPAIAIHGHTGEVVTGSTNQIRPLPGGNYGLFNFKPPKCP